MRKAHIDEVVRALDDVFKQLGVRGGYAEAVKAVEANVADVSPEQALITQVAMSVAEQLCRLHGGKSLSETLGSARKIPTREQLERDLARAPDLTNEDRVTLDHLKKLPRDLRRSLTGTACGIRPKGGPPVLVPRSEYSKICDQISSYVRSGMKLGTAKQKVAGLHGCGVSLINAIWCNRSDRDN